MISACRLWVDYLLFVAVALLWSSSFLFIKIAVSDIPPLSVAAGRILIAAVVLYLYLRLRGDTLPAEPLEWAKFLFIGILGNALPFFLIGYGELSVDSGLAAILMGVMPVATIVLAHLTIADERIHPRKVMGVLLGFGGVVILVGLDALEGIGASTFGQLAVLGGALCYAVTTVFVRRTVSLGGPVMAAGSQIAGAGIVVPAALWLDQPWTLAPSAPSLAAVLVLGLFPTALATLFYFRLVKNMGAGRLSQVNYLIPILGTLWGVMFLGERPELSTLFALFMVVSGIVIVSRRQNDVS